MGFWKEQLNDPIDFPLACQALLDQVLLAAYPDGQSETNDQREICLLDIGFGCGDQTLALLDPDQERRRKMPRISEYVGITNAQQQFECANRRVQKMQKSGDNEHRAMLFCEDAANPHSWSSNLQSAASDLRLHKDDESSPEVWMMGLDCMIHMHPSRQKLLRFAHDELNASYMAFDLLKADGDQRPSIKQRLLLRLVCAITSIPYKNLMTQREYESMLVEAGYAIEDIQIQDISQFVFEPVVKFMIRQHKQLRLLGQSLGPLRVAKWIFGWWAKTGVIRGCVVVARKPESRIANSH